MASGDVEAGARGCGTRDAATRGRHELPARRHAAVLRRHGRCSRLARSRCVRCFRTRMACCCPTCTCGRSLEEGLRENAILVPQQAVTRDPKGRPSRWWSARTARSRRAALKVTRTIGSDWLVDSGLRAGDRVIVEGLQRARPGMPVQPVEAASPRDSGTRGVDRCGRGADLESPGPAPGKSPRS